MTRALYVLVVEDDGGIRDAICEFLADEGYRSRGAANGREALEAIREHGNPCVILLDWMMPVMDGATFRAHQLADPKIAHIPAVLVTAAGSSAVFPVPVEVMLRKPVNCDFLLRVVHTYYRSSTD